MISLKMGFEVTRLSIFLGSSSIVLLTTTAVFCTLYFVEVNQVNQAPEDNVPPVNVLDYEKEAMQKLSKSAASYIQNGATLLTTIKDNREAFGRYRLLPYYLADVSNPNISTTILGQQVAAPIGVSPVGSQRWADEAEGEKATARACVNKRIVCAFSHSASTTIENIAAAAAGGIKWQQIRLYTDKEAILYFVRRAEAAGFKGIVVTVDVPVNGIHYHMMRGEVQSPDLPWESNWPNRTYMVQQMYRPNPGMNWEDMRWLRNQTQLKLVVKGILRAEDAVRAVDCGADAILVSNHGGRVLDGVPASIDVLSSVVSAVAGRAEVYLDSGVRTGMDIVKAIALGARAVFIGRPVMYGLAVDGQKGVEAVLDILKSELTNTMQLLGASQLDKLNSSMIIKPASLIQ